MNLMTSESKSSPSAESIRPALGGTGYQIVGLYTNQPLIALRGTRGEMHHGAFVLTTHGPEHRPDALEGEYWTDRKTSGRMKMRSRTSKAFTRYEDAMREMNSARDCIGILLGPN